jgi:hypothetical protein
MCQLLQVQGKKEFDGRRRCFILLSARYFKSKIFNIIIITFKITLSFIKGG